MAPVLHWYHAQPASQKQQLKNQPQSHCTSITFIIGTMWPPLCQKFDLQALPTPTVVQKAGTTLAVHFRIRLCNDIHVDVLQNTFSFILSSLILILSSFQKNWTSPEMQMTKKVLMLQNLLTMDLPSTLPPDLFEFFQVKTLC